MSVAVTARFRRSALVSVVALLLLTTTLPGRGEPETTAVVPAGVRRPSTVVFQSDFGQKDGAVAAMKGVAMGVNPDLRLFDLTHEIPVFNVWEAGYRLAQTVPYWPAGTVFVSVVDPGVGTARRSVVARTRTGHYVVTPDNGTLTFLAEDPGIEAVREIDETRNRRAGSGESYTFHGRDVYAFTAARLAAGAIGFEGVGPEIPGAAVERIAHPRPEAGNGAAHGGVPVLDVQYGNVWTDIGRDGLAALHGGDAAAACREGTPYTVRILRRGSGENAGKPVYTGSDLPFANSFGSVPVGQPLLYLNSLGKVSLAINEGNFAARHGVGSGPEWEVVIEPGNGR